MKTLLLERAFADTLISYDGRVVVLPGRDDTWPLALRDLLNGECPERCVVGLGPGSYAGIRAAIAFLQGLSLGWGIPLVGYPSTAHLAMCSNREEVTIVGDARRNTLWQVRYRVTAEAITCTEPLHLVSRDSFVPTPEMVSPDAARLATFALPLVTPDGARLAETVQRSEALLTSDPLPLYLHPAVSTAPHSV